MTDIAAAIARHKAILASGEHLLSGLRKRDAQSIVVTSIVGS